MKRLILGPYKYHGPGARLFIIRHQGLDGLAIMINIIIVRLDADHFNPKRIIL